MKVHRLPSSYRSRLAQPAMSRLALAVVVAIAMPSHAANGAGNSKMHVVAYPGGRITTTFEGFGQSAESIRRASLPHGGAIVRVTSCADDGSLGTLRSVLATVADGDTVDLSGLLCDTITLQQGALSIGLIENLTLQGPGMNTLTIDAGRASGVIELLGSGPLELRDLSLANGLQVDSYGGCVSAPGGSLVLKRVKVSSCEAHQVTGARGGIEGGALFAFGDILMEDSELIGNAVTSELQGPAADEGGAGVIIYPVYGGMASTIIGDVTLLRSRVSGNTAISAPPGGLGNVQGGALYSHAGKIKVEDSVMAGNQVFSAFEDANGYHNWTSGGALHALGNDVEIRGSTIAGNQAISVFDQIWNVGGGASIFSGGTIENSTFSNNQSTGNGGGVHHQGGIALKIVNSTISGNSAVRAGGGVYALLPPALDHVTVAFNTSRDDVGGMMLAHGGEIGSSILFGNISGGGQPADLRTSEGTWLVTGSSNLIGDAGMLSLPADTLHADPLLSPLADNGGATQTHALDDGSPAIDGGSNPNGLAFDQRGPGFARVSGAASDIGAFETQSFDDAIFQNGFD